MSTGRREAWSGVAAPTVTRVGGALIVALPRELDDEVLAALRGRTLDQVRQTGVRAVVFEASGLDVVDAEEFAALAAVARAAAWLGVRPLVVGLSAGLVRYLVDADVDTSAFTPYGRLDDALDVLAAEAAAEVAARAAAPASRRVRDEDAEGADGGADGASEAPAGSNA